MTRQPPVYTDDELHPSGVERSDAELITAVRSGDDTAFATLWSRHEVAARRLARQIGNPSNADDLVSEAFLRVLRALKSGSGPDGAFRPYLFSTLRRINIDNGRSYYTRVALTDDERDLELDHSDSAADILADNDESSAAWRAWNSLPDSTKTLLWHLIIEEETPAQIAPLIGTTPNGVSSRAVRARERLRQAFLQQHLLDADNEPAGRRGGASASTSAMPSRPATEPRCRVTSMAAPGVRPRCSRSPISTRPCGSSSARPFWADWCWPATTPRHRASRSVRPRARSSARCATSVTR
jgi:RNA polymerase sigma factor (sigma-70 family)